MSSFNLRNKNIISIHSKFDYLYEIWLNNKIKRWSKLIKRRIRNIIFLNIIRYIHLLFRYTVILYSLFTRNKIKVAIDYNLNI